MEVTEAVEERGDELIEALAKEIAGFIARVLSEASARGRPIDGLEATYENLEALETKARCARMLACLSEVREGLVDELSPYTDADTAAEVAGSAVEAIRAAIERGERPHEFQGDIAASSCRDLGSRPGRHDWDPGPLRAGLEDAIEEILAPIDEAIRSAADALWEAVTASADALDAMVAIGVALRTDRRLDN